MDILDVPDPIQAVPCGLRSCHRKINPGRPTLSHERAPVRSRPAIKPVVASAPAKDVVANPSVQDIMSIADEKAVSTDVSGHRVRATGTSKDGVGCIAGHATGQIVAVTVYAFAPVISRFSTCKDSAWDTKAWMTSRPPFAASTTTSAALLTI